MSEDEKTGQLTIADMILLGALECSEGEIENKFTFEELVIACWQMDTFKFGLRGFEKDYPDSHRLHLNVFGGTALVARGLLQMKEGKLLSLTAAGLARATSIQAEADIVETIPRVSEQLQESVLKILQHRVFKKWLSDPSTPKSFREAGYFWGISPGTPSKVVRERVRRVESTLKEIKKFLKKLNLDHIAEDRVKGRVLFEMKDVERCLDFHNELKARFRKELQLLDPNFKY